MATEQQINANRKNGKLGGPKTQEGKNMTKYNALKHGLFAQEVFLRDEDESELIDLGKRLRNELAPTGVMEVILVDRIIANTWRLKRALKGEKEMIEQDTRSTFGDSNNFGKALSSDFINGYDSYGKFTKYETSLERGIYKALHELQRLQAHRNGEKPMLPVAIDVDMNTEN